MSAVVRDSQMHHEMRWLRTMWWHSPVRMARHREDRVMRHITNKVPLARRKASWEKAPQKR